MILHLKASNNLRYMIAEGVIVAYIQKPDVHPGHVSYVQPWIVAIMVGEQRPDITLERGLGGNKIRTDLVEHPNRDFDLLDRRICSTQGVVDRHVDIVSVVAIPGKLIQFNKRHWVENAARIHQVQRLNYGAYLTLVIRH